MEHPDYPVRHGDPAMDRCTCSGVRHWHALAPYGCDDCECKKFVLDPEATDNARVQFRAVVGQLSGRHVDVSIFAGPKGNSANVGVLRMLEGEARDFVKLFETVADDPHVVGEW